MKDYLLAVRVIELYKSILTDIQNNVNLDAHRKDVEGAIQEIDLSIRSAIAAGTPHSELEKLRNELYYLKYEILERT